MQEVIYRATERQPRNRYSNASDFASDLMNLDRIKIVHRPEQLTGESAVVPPYKRVALLLATAALPVAMFGLLLCFARR
jgi:eukaryotic-like serine/threonine-protein kinase